MKLKRMMLDLLCTVSVAGAVSVGCSEISMFSVDAPEDLQDRIDEIADSKNQGNTDGTTNITIQNEYVGADDGSSAWWTEFSDYFTVPSGKLLHLEFVNNGTGVNNWNNYNLCVSTPYERGADAYSEYFVLRSDSYGWGNADFASALIQNDYPDLDGDGDIWNDFRSYMQGANVTMTVDHSPEGYVFVTIVAETADGLTVTQTYNHPVSSTEDINAFLICDGSWFQVKKAWLADSEAKPVEDVEAESISASGYPSTLELGSEDFWGEAVATVTYADGTTAEVAEEDLTFTVPDLTTTGKKTILYSYSKTKQGNYGKAVAGYYTIDVVNPVVSISAEAVVNVIGAAKHVTLSPAMVKVTAVLADDSEMQLPVAQCNVSFADDKVVYEGTPASYKDAVNITYTTSTGNELTATCDLEIVKSALPAQTEAVGLEDCTTPWWTAFSQDWKVAPGETQAVSMTVSSDNAANWHSPCTILRAASDIAVEYAVVRMDNYGWGDGYASAVLSSDWNFDIFAANIDGSEVSITVTNNGDGTASIRYYVVYADGTAHFQYYDNITVTGDDMQFAIVTEGSYLVFD